MKLPENNQSNENETKGHIYLDIEGIGRETNETKEVDA